MSEKEKKDEAAAVEVPQTVTESIVTETTSPQTVTESKDAVSTDPEAEKMGGTKEVAANSEAMAIEKEKGEVAESKSLPSFFVKKEDRHRVEVDVLSSTRDGRIASVSRVGLGLNFEKEFPYLRHDKVWFEFSLPTYEDMSTYRQRSASWKREAQQNIIDKLSLRNFILVWHLKDWSLTDEKGNKVVLENEDNGALTDESVARVYAVSPTLVDVVMTMFEKDILLA